MKILAILLLALLAGCASAPPAPPPSPDLFNDSAFHAPSQPVSTADLFALSPAMSAYLHSPGFAMRLRERGPIDGLLDALYEKGELKLEYDSSMTRTAAQTYADRSGNCLSLVIMTAAFAKALHMDVSYHSVRVAETWTRAPGLYVGSGHVNLSLGQPTGSGQATSEQGRYVTVDFLPPPEAARLRTRSLEEQDIVTLFMNNRAAEALLQDQLDQAYWWARGAVMQPGAPAIAFNTLGVIYQKQGDTLRAERVYRAALLRDPDNVQMMQNLAPVLAANGKDAEAAAMRARVAQLDPNPPYRFFNEGMQAFYAGDFKKARQMFEREIDRAPYNDEFHFWLAMACLRLGEPAGAREQLALALETSTRDDRRDTYSAKLAHLRALAPKRKVD
jgi:tetratricopeptide (TPR) repeat protein